MNYTPEISAKKKIDVSNVNLHFGTQHVLKDIDFAIRERKITAMIGPSGCGKTTLLRIFNRMHDLNTEVSITGQIKIDGEDIYHKSVHAHELRKKVGMIFQTPNPFIKSIYENVAFGLKIQEFPKNEIPDLVEEALQKSSLFDEVKDKLHAPASSLSGGQQQRLCIARTIAVKPSIILMDEPCSALDPISTHKIEDLIMDLKSQFTIVIVTHNMEQASRISDYTAFMYMGSMIEYNDTQAIFSNPVNVMTENYVNGHFG